MQKRVLLLTGAPGVGKTTVLIETAKTLKTKGISVGGMISREVREGNVWVSFEILDLASGRHGWLAHVNQKSGPQLGKYHVNLQDLDNIGVKAITEAIEKCEVVAIDEVGPMELHSSSFKQAVKQALVSEKPVLIVVHAKAKDPLITEAKYKSDAEVFTVTLANRDNLPLKLTHDALESMTYG